MKYSEIIDKNVATIFQLQRKIGNISDTFLQYSMLCGNDTMGHWNPESPVGVNSEKKTRSSSVFELALIMNLKSKFRDSKQ